MPIATPQNQVLANRIATGLLTEGSSPGIALTCCAREVLSLLEQAIPPSIGGQRVFAHLLSYATLDTHTDEAVVPIPSMVAFARTKHSPCKPETYHKVLLACEAMQLLERRFHRTWTEIRIPLKKHPPALAVLLQGLTHMQQRYANQKFRHFARRVARRLQGGESATSPLHTSPHLSLWHLLVDLLHAHGVATIRPRELGQACERIAQVRADQLATGESESPGEFYAVDSPVVSELTAYDSPPQSDAPTNQRLCQRCTHLPDAQTGESVVPDGADSPVLPDSPAFCTPLGESPVPISFIDSHPLQVLTEKEMTINVMAITDSPNSPVYGSPALPINITSPEPSVSGSVPYADARPFEAIRHEAADMAERLDGSRTGCWLAALIDCVQHYPPHIRRLAEIDTLYHSAFPDFRGKPQKPGAWFRKRCAEYADPHTMVAEAIRLWDDSELPLADIHERLARGQQFPTSAGSVFQEAQQSTHAFETKQQSILHTSMNRAQAEQLCEQIRREGAEFVITAQVYPGKYEGTFLVATVWDDVEDTWANAGEWNQYFPKAKACYISHKALAA